MWLKCNLPSAGSLKHQDFIICRIMKYVKMTDLLLLYIFVTRISSFQLYHLKINFMIRTNQFGVPSIKLTLYGQERLQVPPTYSPGVPVVKFFSRYVFLIMYRSYQKYTATRLQMPSGALMLYMCETQGSTRS